MGTTFTSQNGNPHRPPIGLAIAEHKPTRHRAEVFGIPAACAGSRTTSSVGLLGSHLYLSSTPKRRPEINVYVRQISSALALCPNEKIHIRLPSRRPFFVPCVGSSAGRSGRRKRNISYYPPPSGSTGRFPPKFDPPSTLVRYQ